MASKYLNCNFCKCAFVALLFIFMLPYYYAFFHLEGPYEKQQFAKAIRILQLEHKLCENPERKEVIAYALKRYNKLGRFDVSIFHVAFCAGINAPWCPGITIDPKFIDNPHTFAMLILHEAAHDYYPYLGHTQHERLGIW